jgi:hypothetical protein
MTKVFYRLPGSMVSSSLVSVGPSYRSTVGGVFLSELCLDGYLLPTLPDYDAAARAMSVGSVGN